MITSLEGQPGVNPGEDRDVKTMGQRSQTRNSVCSRTVRSVIVIRALSLTSEEQRRLLDQATSGTKAQREIAYRALIFDFRKPAMSVICRTLLAAGLGMEHAEEAWQQCLYKFFTVGAQRFRGESSVRTYFVRAALYASVDLVRLALRHRCIDADPVELSGPPRPEDRPMEDQLWEIEALRSCLSSLSGDHAEAVELYYLKELGSCAKCARQLKISSEAFMKRLERARNKLETCIQLRMRDS